MDGNCLKRMFKSGTCWGIQNLESLNKIKASRAIPLRDCCQKAKTNWC